MSIRKITLASGTKVWQARVMVDGQRRSALRSTYEAAKAAEADLRRAVQHAAVVATAPGTLREGLRGYVARSRPAARVRTRSSARVRWRACSPPPCRACSSARRPN
jgi:hypothetical protein